MSNISIPSRNSLTLKENLIRLVQDLCAHVSSIESQPISSVASPFKEGWRSFNTGSSTYSIDDFCADVLADGDCKVGMSFMGELKVTDLPASLINGEAKVEVLGTDDSRILLVTLISLTTSPYHWEYTYPYGKTWRSWATQ